MMEQHHDWHGGVLDDITYRRWLGYIKKQFSDNRFGFDNTPPISKTENRFLEGWISARKLIKDRAFVKLVNMMQCCSVDELFPLTKGSEVKFEKQYRRLEEDEMFK